VPVQANVRADPSALIARKDLRALKNFSSRGWRRIWRR